MDALQPSAPRTRPRRQRPHFVDDHANTAMPKMKKHQKAAPKTQARRTPRGPDQGSDGSRLDMPAQRRLAARRCSRSELFSAALAGHHHTTATRQSAADGAERDRQNVTPLAQIARGHGAARQAGEQHKNARPQSEPTSGPRELSHAATASMHVQTTPPVADSGRPTSAHR